MSAFNQTLAEDPETNRLVLPNLTAQRGLADCYPLDGFFFSVEVNMLKSAAGPRSVYPFAEQVGYPAG